MNIVTHLRERRSARPALDLPERKPQELCSRCYSSDTFVKFSTESFYEKMLQGIGHLCRACFKELMFKEIAHGDYQNLKEQYERELKAEVRKEFFEKMTVADFLKLFNQKG